MNDLEKMTPQEKRELLRFLEREERENGVKGAQDNLLKFAKHVYPQFKEGPHHRIIWKILQDVLTGDKTRVIINISPRFGKSLFISWLFAAYYLGKNPDHKIIMATHTAALSEDFGRQVRNLIKSEEYRSVFPGTTVAKDQKAAGQWSTEQNGSYYAVGVGGALAGRGAHLLITDDIHNEQDVVTDGTATFEKAWAWYQTGPLQRLMPGGKIIVIMTRWHDLDLTGRLLQYQIDNPDADQWEIVRLPPILPSGRSLWPEQWPIEELLAKKASMAPRYWNAQYMQDPSSDESALIKREQWRIWQHDRTPEYEYVIITLDGAFTAGSSADFSAMTVWGVWRPDEGKTAHIILLDAWRGRVEFPQLKSAALKFYRDWKPESFIIEAKASGLSLIQELRAMGIPVTDFKVNRGTAMHSNDKISRVNGITDLFASGFVWAPDKRWAWEVIEECAKFPNGANDDFVDTTVMALMRFRTGGFIRLPSDEEDLELLSGPPRKTPYQII